MESIWKDAVKERQPIKYTGTHHTKVAVIGAGMVGILTAYLLKEAGIEAVVLEAGMLAGGQTGHTTAKITSQHGMIYSHLEKYFGREAGFLYAKANERSIREYERIIEKEKINCDFKTCPAYLYATEGEGAKERVQGLKRELELAALFGIQAEFTTRTELPFQVAGAEVFYNQAQFHPLKFIDHLSGKLEIYELSKVNDIKDNCLFLENGVLEAEHIVFACHFPWMIMPGYYFLRMHQERSHVLALHQNNEIQGMYRDMSPSGFSFRSYGKILLLGGCSHRTGHTKGGNFDELRNRAKHWYPNGTEQAYWSAQDCMTIDKIPYIGHLTASIPNWYIATGFGKWGMTGSMVSAGILCDMILGRENELRDLFTPQRMNWPASFSQLCGNIGSAAKNLSKRLLPLSIKGVGKPPGCQHMGCQLAWNKEEQTWDCPCHGSRYTADGHLICGPSQKSLDRQDKGE